LGAHLRRRLGSVEAVLGDAELQQVLVGFQAGINPNERDQQAAADESETEQDQAVHPQALGQVPDRTEAAQFQLSRRGKGR